MIESLNRLPASGAVMPHFDRLYRAAISEWPAALDLPVRDGVGTHIVDGLSKLERDIAQKWVGHPSEVLMTNLHWAIMTVAHAAFAERKPVVTAELDQQAIRKRFEADLNRIIADARSWDLRAVSLAKSYFR